jgi:hypothetical protein
MQAQSTAVDERWHGWSIRGKSIHVGYLPGRKSCCLYTIDGSVMDVLAYFRSEAHAQACLAMLDQMAGVA